MEFRKMLMITLYAEQREKKKDTDLRCCFCMWTTKIMECSSYVLGPGHRMPL